MSARFFLPQLASKACHAPCDHHPNISREAKCHDYFGPVEVTKVRDKTIKSRGDGVRGWDQTRERKQKRMDRLTKKHSLRNSCRCAFMRYDCRVLFFTTYSADSSCTQQPHLPPGQKASLRSPSENQATLLCFTLPRRLKHLGSKDSFFLLFKVLYVGQQTNTLLRKRCLRRTLSREASRLAAPISQAVSLPEPLGKKIQPHERYADGGTPRVRARTIIARKIHEKTHCRSSGETACSRNDTTRSAQGDA